MTAGDGLPTHPALPFALAPALTVSQANQRARQALEGSLGRLSVVGEISNAKVVSGHQYFSLKDELSQLPAVMFRREAATVKFVLRDGMEVTATGRLTIYAPYGRYQMVVDKLEPRGAGALQAAFEQLKSRLQSEGLFAAARKRQLPLVPRRVAVVTSPTGAVIRDIIHVATRRFPGAQILVVPARVQGAESAAGIVRAIERAGNMAGALGLDVLILARGGGSLEDLWGFNEESVARAIASCPLPVVTGVGHETDVTIADFVADRRAATPSAAAETVFPLQRDLLHRLQAWRERAHAAMRREIQQRRYELRAVQAELGDGRRLLTPHLQRLSDAELSLRQSSSQLVERRRSYLRNLDVRLLRHHPKVRLRELSALLREREAQLLLIMRQRLLRHRDLLRAQLQRLTALSPLAVLERGYSIVIGPDGAAVRRADQVAPGDQIDIRLASGRLDAVVDRIHEPRPA